MTHPKKKMFESWTEYSHRVGRIRKAQFREVRGKGNWNSQVRKVTKAQKKQIKERQGRGDLNSRARKGNQRMQSRSRLWGWNKKTEREL